GQELFQIIPGRRFGGRDPGPFRRTIGGVNRGPAKPRSWITRWCNRSCVEGDKRAEGVESRKTSSGTSVDPTDARDSSSSETPQWGHRGGALPVLWRSRKRSVK